MHIISIIVFPFCKMLQNISSRKYFTFAINVFNTPKEKKKKKKNSSTFLSMKKHFQVIDSWKKQIAILFFTLQKVLGSSVIFIFIIYFLLNIYFFLLKRTRLRMLLL